MKEWITSEELTKNRIWLFKGKINRLSTSNNRKILKLFKSLIIKESKFTIKKSVYSYLQYHWCPTTFNEIKELLTSSVKYKIFNEGITKNIKKTIGIKVQIISIIWPSNKLW